MGEVEEYLQKIKAERKEDASENEDDDPSGE
jgi:hypothetical protein